MCKTHVTVYTHVHVQHLLGTVYLCIQAHVNDTKWFNKITLCNISGMELNMLLCFFKSLKLVTMTTKMLQ